MNLVRNDIRDYCGNYGNQHVASSLPSLLLLQPSLSYGLDLELAYM